MIYEEFCNKFIAFEQTINARAGVHEPEPIFLKMIGSNLLRRYYFVFDEEISSILLVIEIGFGHLRTDPEKIDQKELRSVLLSLISDLNLLVVLSEKGFNLGVIMEEWIWSASIKLEKLPGPEFLKLIELGD